MDQVTEKLDGLTAQMEGVNVRLEGVRDQVGSLREQLNKVDRISAMVRGYLFLRFFSYFPFPVVQSTTGHRRRYSFRRGAIP